MWCDRCRADAAAHVSAETGRASCATCGGELGQIRRPATDQARELLRRWSTDLDLEPPPASTKNSVPSQPATFRPSRPAEITSALPSETQSSSESESLKVVGPTPDAADEPETRSSSAPSVDPMIHHMPEPPSADAPQSSSQNEKGAPDMFNSSKPRRGTTEQWPAPTVQMPAAWPKNSPPARGPVGTVLGHIMAYAGILAVTGGTALVIWGYFGGPADYAPTGWLVAAGGQMLLFLGVVTIVSEGLERSSREMQCQVEILDQRLERMERNATKIALQNRLNTTGTASTTGPLRHAVGA